MNSRLVLVVGQDDYNRKKLRFFLESRKFKVIEANNVKNTFKACSDYEPQLLLVDADVAKKDDFMLCYKVRNITDAPMIVISNENSIDDEEKAIENGADGFVFRPFDFRELYARMKAILRRIPEDVTNGAVIDYPYLHIDCSNKIVIAFGKEIVFTKKEHQLFSLLATNPNHTFSREELTKLVWKYGGETVSRTIDTHIKTLRKKLKIPEDSLWNIITVRGIGYKFQINNF